MADVQEDSPIGGQGQAEGGAPAADEEAELAKLQAELYGGEGDGGDASEDPGSGAAQGDGEGGGEAAVMTKSQMKKKARLERMLAKRAESRQREKAVRAQRRAEANERKAAEWAGMSEEQKEAVRKEKQARLGAHKDAEKQLKERLKQSLETGPRIVIDLDWEKRMNENDLRHLVQQLSFSYAANKQVDRPAHMVLTSFKGGVAALANKLNPGMDKWFITRTEQHYGELFSSPEDKARLVYLTADAEDELDELDESKIYIIGGLVDHNRYKGLCEEQAQAAGIPTARLPINRYVQLASRAVLTVNHVFQILVEYYARRDWVSTLDVVLPKRKRADLANQPPPQQQQQRQQQQRAVQSEIPPSKAAQEVAAGDGTAQSNGAGSGSMAEDDLMEADAGKLAVAEETVKGEGASAAATEGGSSGAGEVEEGRGTKRKAEGEPAAAD